METKIGSTVLGARLTELQVITTHGEMTLPNDLEGKWFVLFSHPADFTPVSTTEFVALAAEYDVFQTLNTELIGLSADPVTSHIKWTEWIKENMYQEIPFPIIADSLGRVAKKLGMIDEAKEIDAVCATFIIDDKGKLRAKMYYPQEVGRSVTEILRIIKALQHSDKYGVVLPENWPNNSVLVDDVIIPPAKTEQLAQKHRKTMKYNEDMSYKDWWFISKPREN